MRFEEIEVNGIKCIVINRKTEWSFMSGMWKRIIRDDGLPGTPINPKPKDRPKTHEQMMEIVNLLKMDRRFRMWVHHDTLNIVRKD